MSETVYIHYGSDHFEPSLFIPVRNCDWKPKPADGTGLWASQEGKKIFHGNEYAGNVYEDGRVVYGWKEWYEDSHFNMGSLKRFFRFKLSGAAKEALWKFCGIYHIIRDWLDTSEGEIYTDGYKPGDPLGEPIDYREMILQELTKGQGIIFSEGSVQDRLNQIIEDLQEIQDRVAELSDELDSDTLEDAEADIGVVIGRIGDVIEEHGWKLR